MKKLLFLSFLFLGLSQISWSQCRKCSDFEEALKQPLRVYHLQINPHLNGETLKAVPKTIAKFENLLILYITDQGLSEFPEEIGTLTKLKELSFAGNQLETLPDFVFQLKNLKELILFDNPFSKKEIKRIRKRLKKELPNTKLMIDDNE